MAQFYTTAVEQLSLSCGLNGPLDNSNLIMQVRGGETLRWGVHFVGEQYSILSINPAADTITISQSGCIAAGDTIRVVCHDNVCDGKTLNGAYVVDSVDSTGTILTLAADALANVVAQSFEAVPPVPGCTTAAVTAPTVIRLQDIASYAFRGRITNRLPGEQTRLALPVQTTLGSSIIQVSDIGSVRPFDNVSIPDAGISGAKVLSIYTEHGKDWAVLNQSATKSGCSGLTSQVGIIAEFDFEFDAAGGTAYAVLPANITQALPKIGRKTIGEGGATSYAIGIFSILVSYPSVTDTLESELVAGGSVLFTPSTFSS